MELQLKKSLNSKMPSCENNKLLKWLVGKMTSCKVPFDKMTSWCKDKLVKGQVGEMTSWWNDKLVKWYSWYNILYETAFDGAGTGEMPLYKNKQCLN